VSILVRFARWGYPSFSLGRFFMFSVALAAVSHRIDLIFAFSVSVTFSLAKAMTFLIPGILVVARARAWFKMTDVVCVACRRLSLSLANIVTHMGKVLPRPPSLF